MNLASLAPNLPFLDALAAWWLSRAAGDLDRVADGLFLVPTRRAARGLSDAFLRQAAGAPLLLPRIAAIGGMDEARSAPRGGRTAAAGDVVAPDPGHGRP
jgi:ATP-dependent helicase/nuclease subunit B